jgi:hypothetical protein
MTALIRRPLYQFKLNGVVVELAADPVQNEALEGTITRSVDFELKDKPTLATNVPVDLNLVERIASTTIPQFSGWTNKRSGQSYPNRAILPCVGPLSRFRRVPVLGDHDLTGMTDGEAWMHIADACNVPYDAGDIQDAGYVLGAIRPIYWLKNQKAHEFIAELDMVFGMATIEIGDGRVIRFAYDRVPDAANIGTTYTRGAIDAEVLGKPARRRRSRRHRQLVGHHRAGIFHVRRGRRRWLHTHDLGTRRRR